MSKEKIGKVSVTPKGEWVSGTTYEALDIVRYGGNSWLARQETSTEPVEGEGWQRLTSITADGITSALGFAPIDLTTPFELIDDIEITETGIRNISRWIKLKAALLVYDASACADGSTIQFSHQFAFRHTDGTTHGCSRYYYTKWGLTLGYVFNGFALNLSISYQTKASATQSIAFQRYDEIENVLPPIQSTHIYYYKFATDSSAGLPVGLKVKIYGVKL